MVDDLNGNLIHLYNERIVFPGANIVDGSALAENTEIEVFPSAFLKMGQIKMPVLKIIDAQIQIEHHTLPPQVADGGYWNAIAFIYNSDEDDIDDANLIAVASLDGFDGASTTTLSIVLVNNPVDLSFGNDGVLLRPKITVRTAVGNDIGAQLALHTFRLELMMYVDWVDVSKSEFQDYLQELWFAQEFD